MVWPPLGKVTLRDLGHMRSGAPKVRRQFLNIQYSASLSDECVRACVYMFAHVPICNEAREENRVSGSITLYLILLIESLT